MAIPKYTFKVTKSVTTNGVTQSSKSTLEEYFKDSGLTDLSVKAILPVKKGQTVKRQSYMGIQLNPIVVGNKTLRYVIIISKYNYAILLRNLRQGKGNSNEN